MKSLYWHPLARSDAECAAAWYGKQGGLVLELAFVDALHSAIDRIARHPGIGSNRYASLLKAHALRFWPVHGFPYLIFYIELDSRLDIWRVLHAQRDIPEWMRE